MIHAILNYLNLTPSSRPPVTSCKTVEEKDKLAEWIVANFLANGSATLESVIERQADLRLCSLICRHLAMAIFSPTGPDYAGRLKGVSESLGFNLVLQPSGRYSDTRTGGIMAAPAKYKGYGATLNRPNDRGHLFQINMLSFVEEKPLIGILEAPDRDSAYPVKGMVKVGDKGPWRLYRLDPSLSDDGTALLVKPERADVRVEFALLSSPDDVDFKLFYRINTAR